MSVGKKIGVGLSALVVLAVLFSVEEHFRGKIALRKWKAQMEASGEVLRVELLAPRPVPADQNGMPTLIWAAAQLGGMSSDHYPPTMRCTDAGKVVLIFREASWTPGSRGRGTNVTWGQVAEIVHDREDALAAVLEAFEFESFQSNLDYLVGFSLMVGHLAPLKTVAQVLSASAVNDLRVGATDAAVRKLEVLIRLQQTLGAEPLIISQLVRIAMLHIAFGATWQAVESDKLSDDQLAKLQRAWSTVELLSEMERALAMERAIGSYEMQRVRQSSGGFQQAFRPGGGRTPPPASFSLNYLSYLFDPELVMESILSPLWKFTWSHQDELRYLKTMHAGLVNYRRGHANRSFQMVAESSRNLARHEESLTVFDRMRFMFSQTLLPHLEGSTRKAWIAQTTKELAVAGIALKRYALKHGEPAASLENLSPEFLERAPWDYMDGKPLKYTATKQIANVERSNSEFPNAKETQTSKSQMRREFVLYSVGEDGADDHGDARPRGNSRTFNLQNGRDLVWPEPASVEDVAAYNARTQTQ